MTILRKLCILLCSIVVGAGAQIDSSGIKLIEQRKNKEAQTFFESAVEKNEKDPEARYWLAVSLSRQGKFDDAEDEIDEAIDLDEHVAKYHLARGQILGQQAMNANVISQAFLAPKIKNAFLRASELDPSNIEARISLFNYYVMAPGIMGGSDEKAIAQVTELKKLDPFRGHLLHANYYNRKKDSVSAELEIKKAIAVSPDNSSGYKQLGYFYMNQKRFKEAYGQMKKYIDLEPGNPDSYDSYGDVLRAEGKYDQAIEKYLFALSVDKNFSASIFSLADCYEKKSMIQKAKETYQWFLSVEPNGRRSEAAQKKINEL
ncbi:MAG: tetratricopeptide repeat protein [Ignavibacteriales bacterium]|nr:tetratricopeptide repeat protein [Ignavibacteriales bacterium]